MIKSIWTRIALLLAFAILPATLLQLKLQSDSVQLVFSLADKTAVRAALGAYLNQLKENARLLPAREAEYKTAFGEALSVKRAVDEFFLVQRSITEDIQAQTLWITGFALLISLLLSLWISRGIVGKVRLLIAERERSAAKLRDLSALENWQTVARTLVHELRAPITPIKLIASDIEYKFAALDPQAFARYLHHAGTLVTEQVTAIEAMISGFTTFGKLPAPVLREAELHLFLDGFLQTYQHSFGEGVSFKNAYDGCQATVAMDAKLMRDLLFNLCKNAAEANAGVTQITLRALRQKELVLIFLHNTGAEIPPALATKIFDPYVSTKKESQGANWGLGLTIARKIALDHGGDLILAPNPAMGGVTFRIELPLSQAAKTTERTVK